MLAKDRNYKRAFLLCLEVLIQIFMPVFLGFCCAERLGVRYGRCLSGMNPGPRLAPQDIRTSERFAGLGAATV